MIAIMRREEESDMGGYIELLRESAREVKNCACMGLDPRLSALPYDSGNVRSDLNAYFQELFRRMNLAGSIPAAFKPNIGYYQALDRPREEDFSGSLALADVLELIENFFPGIPVILDSKRGDIARSSENYAIEAFDVWQSSAVTVSPYMGSDSVEPFLSHLPGEKGVYVLDRTSNPGGKDFQNLMVIDKVDEKELYPLYMSVAHHIVAWSSRHPGIGAVVGATNLAELEDIAGYYGDKDIPLLIPGVGSQGGSATETLATLRKVGYPVELARINSSSGLTHPWKEGPAPEDWLDRCITNLSRLLTDTAV